MSRVIKTIFALILLIFLGNPSAAFAYQVQQNHIFDEKQQLVHLYGINWFGFETNNAVAYGLWTRNWQEMLTQIKQTGFTAVRLPFCPGTLMGKKPTAINYALNKDLQNLNSLQILDKFILELDKQGLYIVLDHHNLDCHTSPPLWYSDLYSESNWINDLVFVAKRYHTVTHFIGLDLKNEPHGTATWGTGNVMTDWNNAAERAVQEIVKVNPNILFFVEGIEKNPVCSANLGIGGGSNLEPQWCKPLTIPADKLVFSPHLLGPDNKSQSYFDDGDFPKNLANVWKTQFGFLAENEQLVIPGDFGGHYTHGGNAKDIIWQDTLVDYLIDKNIENFFYTAWNPDSDEINGILKDDWKTVWDDKLHLLQRLMTKTKQPPQASFPLATETPPAAPATASCKLNYVMSSRWKNGFLARIKVTNDSAVEVKDWQVIWQYPSNIQLASSWGVNLTTQETVFNAAPTLKNKIIPVGGAIEFGVLLRFTGDLPNNTFQFQSFFCH